MQRIIRTELGSAREPDSPDVEIPAVAVESLPVPPVPQKVQVYREAPKENESVARPVPDKKMPTTIDEALELLKEEEENAK